MKLRRTLAVLKYTSLLTFITLLALKVLLIGVTPSSQLGQFYITFFGLTVIESVGAFTLWAILLVDLGVNILVFLRLDGHKTLAKVASLVYLVFAIAVRVIIAYAILLLSVPSAEAPAFLDDLNLSFLIYLIPGLTSLFYGIVVLETGKLKSAIAVGRELRILGSAKMLAGILLAFSAVVNRTSLIVWGPFHLIYQYITILHPLAIYLLSDMWLDSVTD